MTQKQLIAFWEYIRKLKDGEVKIKSELQKLFLKSHCLYR